MRAFRVIVSGVNLILSVDDEIGRYGFEVARFVRATTESQAADVALALIQESPQFTSALNDPGDPPSCTVTEIVPLSTWQDLPEKQPGFAFYPIDGDTSLSLH